jgi:hypothetical protein
MQGTLHYQQTNKISVTPSQWGSYILLTGTSKESKGGYSGKQLDLAGFRGPNKVSHDQATKNAMSIVKARLTDDLGGVLKLGLGHKIVRLWDGDDYAVGFSIRKSLGYDSLQKNGTFGFLVNIANKYFTVMILLFIGWLVFNFKKKHVGLICLPLLGYASIHLLAEVQARYHIPFMPFIYFGASIFIIDVLCFLENNRFVKKVTSYF